MATETKIARVAFMDRGVYSGVTEYSKWDFVTTADSTYLYIGETPATGKPVTDTAYWKCIADGKQATVAAELADTARTELTTAVNTKLGEADGKIEEMDGTLSAYDGRVSQVESDIDQLAGEVSLLDAVHSDKIKDIESVISTMNPNQSAQLSASGRKTVSLPKNAANGGMQVKMEGLTAGNLVMNGDFRNGTTGWSPIVASRDLFTLQQNGLKITCGIETFTTDLATYMTVSDFIAGNKYYIAFFIDEYLQVLGGATFKLRHYVSGSYKDIASIPLKKGLTSVVVTSADTSSGGKYLTLQGSGSSISPGDFYVIKHSIVLNLTAIFGAGNEPTKEQCDLIFSDYFEGVKSFEPTGRVRGVDASGENPTHLYITAPELRSNGTVKDEIRKGSNGYELVKRVGVIETANEGVERVPQPLNFTSGWTAAPAVTINSATQFTTTSTGGISINGALPGLNKNVIVRIKGTVTGGSLTVRNGNNTVGQFNLNGAFDAVYITNYGLQTILYLSANSNTTVNIEKLSIKVIDGISTIVAPSKAWELGDSVHYTLATPEIIPISYGGVLNSAENGAVYHEPIIADAGVYGTNMAILLTDYLIASIEEIIKHEGGVDTYLNASTAVIAPDGLSFTHPDLASGDLVLFTYAFDKESTNGNITATFYDSNVVKIDTVTGKAYKITDVVTNGVLTRTLTEV